MPEDHSRSLYINALEPHQVTADATEQGTWMVKRLPIMRLGKWNGMDYTAADMREIASNFGTLRDDSAFEPGLWPRHNYNHEGEIIPQDASAALGWYRGVEFDEATGVLFGDAEVFDETTARDMQRGKLRYISAEIRNTADQGRSLVGAAFVHDPAVKGLPWHLVINAADYSAATQSPQSTPPTPRGGKTTMNMSIKDRFLALFAAKDTEDPEVLSQAAEELEAALTPTAPEPPEDETPPAGKVIVQDEDATDSEALARQLTQSRKAFNDQAAEVAELRKQVQHVQINRQHDQADALVDKWAVSGYVSPAAREYAMPMAQYALAAEGKVTILSDTGTKTFVPMISVLEELLKLTSPAAVAQSATGSLIWAGSEDMNAESDEECVELGKAMAQKVAHTPTQ